MLIQLINLCRANEKSNKMYHAVILLFTILCKTIRLLKQNTLETINFYSQASKNKHISYTLNRVLLIISIMTACAIVLETNVVRIFIKSINRFTILTIEKGKKKKNVYFSDSLEIIIVNFMFYSIEKINIRVVLII